MTSPTLCVLPWMHVSTQPSGALRACCHTSGQVPRDENGRPYYLQDDRIEEFWNGREMRAMRLDMLEGRRPSACRTCFTLEDSGAASPRIHANRRYAHHLSRVIESQDGSAPLHIAYVDLRLGNICNLRCRMCSPLSSHLLTEEFRALFPANVGTVPDSGWADDISVVVGSLKNHLNDIEEIYLTGGEPTLVRPHDALLRACIDAGVSSRIHLRYNTNATNFPKRLIALWRQFASVQLSLSIDAVGDLARYIRYPSNWKSIDANIRRIDDLSEADPRIRASITCTVQILNMTRLVDLIDYLGTLKRVAHFPWFNILHSPPMLDARVLPADLKTMAADRLLEWQARNPDVQQNGQTIEGLIRHLQSADRSNLLREFFRRNDAMDAYRGGIKLADVLPEIEALRTKIG